MDDDGDHAAPEPINKARLVMPLFDGKGDARATIKFLELVDSYQTVTRLTDEETARAVPFALIPGSTAETWYQNLKDDRPNDVAEWPALRARIIERFSPPLNPSQKGKVADALSQGAKEDVQSFLDRVRSAQKLINKGFPENMRTGNQADSYRVHEEASIMEKFLRGLRMAGDFKEKVNSAAGCTTLAQYLTVAVTIEHNMTKNASLEKASVAALAAGGDDDDPSVPHDGDTAEVAALRQQLRNRPGRGGGRGGGGGGGRGTGKKKGTPRDQSGPPPSACWNCGDATHWNSDCPHPKKKKQGGDGSGGSAPNNQNSGKKQNYNISELQQKSLLQGMEMAYQQMAMLQQQQQASPGTPTVNALATSIQPMDGMASGWMYPGFGNQGF